VLCSFMGGVSVPGRIHARLGSGRTERVHRLHPFTDPLSLPPFRRGLRLFDWRVPRIFFGKESRYTLTLKHALFSPR